LTHKGYSIHTPLHFIRLLQIQREFIPQDSELHSKEFHFTGTTNNDVPKYSILVVLHSKRQPKNFHMKRNTAHATPNSQPRPFKTISKEISFQINLSHTLFKTMSDLIIHPPTIEPNLQNYQISITH